FVVPATGTYQFNTTGPNGSFVDYYYKVNNATCGTTGWTCMGRTYYAMPMGAFNWNANDTIMFLLNSEDVNTTSQTFMIKCSTRVYDSISVITCVAYIPFYVTGYDDPNYPICMIGLICSIGTPQGGGEHIYRFVVPATGTYQFSTT